MLVRNFLTDRITYDMNHGNYDYMLYSLIDGEYNMINRIKANGNHLRQVDLIEKESGEIVVAGMYSKKNMYSIKGIMHQRINREGSKPEPIKSYEFDEDFFTKLLVSPKKERVIRKISKGSYEDPYYVLYNILEYDNGDLLFVAEQIHTVISNYVATYFHENIALIRLDEQGNIVWYNKIGKKNIKNNVAYYSHYNLIKREDENVYFLYNGNTQNLHHRMGPVKGSFGSDQGKAFLATKLTPDGEYKRIILAIDSQLEGIRIRPGLTRWISDDELLLFGQDPSNVKNQRFVKLKFKE